MDTSPAAKQKSATSMLSVSSSVAQALAQRYFGGGVSDLDQELAELPVHHHAFVVIPESPDTPMNRSRVITVDAMVAHSSKFSSIRRALWAQTMEDDCVLARATTPDLGRVEVWHNVNTKDIRKCPLRHLYLSMGFIRGPVVLYRPGKDVPETLPVILNQRLHSKWLEQLGQVSAPSDSRSRSPPRTPPPRRQSPPPSATAEKDTPASSMVYNISFPDSNNTSSTGPLIEQDVEYAEPRKLQRLDEDEEDDEPVRRKLPRRSCRKKK